MLSFIQGWYKHYSVGLEQVDPNLALSKESGPRDMLEFSVDGS